MCIQALPVNYFCGLILYHSTLICKISKNAIVKNIHIYVTHTHTYTHTLIWLSHVPDPELHEPRDHVDFAFESISRAGLIPGT